MTEIQVDRVNMVRLMDTQVERTDAIDTVLGRMPSGVDGGIASALIAFLASAAAEGSGLVADSYRALAAITTAALDDMDLGEEEAAATLSDLEKQIEQQ